MAPSVMLDNASDFSNAPQDNGNFAHPRTLLLSPPSLSSHPEKLDKILAAHDRSATDIQMLDRLSLSLVSLPEAVYEIILILTDADESRTESRALLSKDLFSQIARAMKPGGKLCSQDGKFAIDDQEERKEAIFAGLVVQDNDMVKPNYTSDESVPLRIGRIRSQRPVAVTSALGTGAVSLNLIGKRKNGPPQPSKPAGVGFIDFSDDFDAPEIDGSDDELIDEDTLLDEEDKKVDVIQRMQPSSCLCLNLTLTTACSARVPTQGWQATTGMQRLHLRSGPEARIRRCSQTLECRSSARQAQSR